ncbi:RHOMBOID-like protein 1 [Pistacia vera]|uniref:RHOMBOID-like protein 1 n=1 Tax=Pistacia vera TaxID=55513 RepID=UPI0012634523|nr:RHOMBOID-like protein 1 [Pistacia vera]
MSRDAPRGLEIKVQPTGGGPPMASTSGTMATSRTPVRRVSPSSASASAISGMSPPSLMPRPSQADDWGEFGPFKRYCTWLVPAFVVANIVMFIITMYVNDCPKNTGSSCLGKFLGRFSFQPMKQNPLLGPSSQTLEKMGAMVIVKMTKQHQTWRLLTCVWLHGGVFHLLTNMLSLLFIGIRLEQEFGFVRIGLLYVISGFGGSVMSALFLQQSISVGASGALFGLLGAMLSELIANWTIYANKFAAMLTLIFIIVVNLAMGILPHVDNFAHIGGFFSGFLLGFVLLIRPQFGWVSQKSVPPGYTVTSVKSKHKTYQYVLWVFSLILLIVGFTLGLVQLSRGVNMNDYCSRCHYMSCIPTSLWNCKAQEVYCQSTQIGNEVNLTCSGSGKSNIYPLSAADNPAKLDDLCSEFCS